MCQVHNRRPLERDIGVVIHPDRIKKSNMTFTTIETVYPIKLSVVSPKGSKIRLKREGVCPELCDKVLILLHPFGYSLPDKEAGKNLYLLNLSYEPVLIKHLSTDNKGGIR